jgi:hypothetical protein
MENSTLNCLIPLLACVCATRQQIDACQDDTSCLACLSSGDAGDADFNVEQGCSVAGRAHMRKLAYEKTIHTQCKLVVYTCSNLLVLTATHELFKRSASRTLFTSMLLLCSQQPTEST